VAIGRDQVTAPHVHSSERKFKACLLAWNDQCRRCLKRRDRASVVAETRLQASDRSVEPNNVRVPEARRRLIQSDRFSIGVDARGTIGCLPIRLGGLGVSSSLALVLRNLDEPSQVVSSRSTKVQTNGLCDPAVQ
jgi:hypothetical protein